MKASGERINVLYVCSEIKHFPSLSRSCFSLGEPGCKADADPADRMGVKPEMVVCCCSPSGLRFDAFLLITVVKCDYFISLP